MHVQNNDLLHIMLTVLIFYCFHCNFLNQLYVKREKHNVEHGWSYYIFFSKNILQRHKTKQNLMREDFEKFSKFRNNEETASGTDLMAITYEK